MGLNLAATISLDGSQFERGLARAGSAVSSAIKGWVAGAVGVYAIEEAFRKTIDTAEELVNTSKRLDISVEKLQVLGQAAKYSGIELATVTTAMEKLGQARALALGQGLSGSSAQGYDRFFQQLGVGGNLIRGGGNNDIILKAIAAKVAATANPQTLIEPLRQVFGRAGGALIPFLQTNFGELEAKMKSFGAIMSEDAAVKLKDLADKFDLVGRVLSAQLAPVILQVAIMFLKMVDAGARFVEWINQKTGLGKGAAAAGAIVGQIGWKGLFGIEVDTIKNIASGQDTPEARAALRAKYGIDQKAGIAAQNDSTAAFQSGSDDLIKTLEELIKELQSPAKPITKQTQEAIKGVAEHARQAGKEGDELTRVGNFLGTSRAAIEGAQQQMERHAQETANNTGKSVTILGAILTALQKPDKSGNRPVQPDEIFFPAN